jgi:hypothetical protein
MIPSPQRKQGYFGKRKCATGCLLPVIACRDHTGGQAASGTTDVDSAFSVHHDEASVFVTHALFTPDFFPVVSLDFD